MRSLQRYLAISIATSLAVTIGTTQVSAAPASLLTTDHGVVATDHLLASRAGIEVMRRGGNAIDGACAAVFAAGVVNPAGSGLGGGAFLLLERAGGGPPVVLDARETAPAAATRDMFSRAGVAEDASSVGGLAIGVPGELLGCAEAVRRFGKLPLRRVLAPAIRLARTGFVVEPYLAQSIGRLEAELRHRPELARIFLPGGRPLRAGQRARRPRLGRALATIARQGINAFYRGWIARDLVASVRRVGGVLSLADMRNYRVKIRQPLTTKFRGYDIYLMPPPSSAGIAIIETLNVLRRDKLAALGHNSPRYLHRLTEAFKHAFADRARFLGDADFVPVPVTRLTSQRYADQLARRIGSHVAPPDSYGSGGARSVAGNDAGTSHISAIDAQGNAAAVTSSINTSFGALVIGRRSGIILNNTMNDFSTRPGKANAYGLMQSAANAVAPGKRPLSSMSPTIVSRAGRATLALGASGGPTIITATLQVMLNVIVFHMNVADAVKRPRIHHQWRPNTLWVESGIPEGVLEALGARGHKVKLVKRPPQPHTAVQAVAADKRLTAASDARKFGSPAGF